MKPTPMLFAAMAAFTASAATPTPEVTSVTMRQSTTSRLVTIEYTLDNAPAVVTLDVETNANTSAAADDPGWASIGGEALWNATGDVWKKVGAEGGTFNGTIAWRPDHSWPDHDIPANGARAVVTAWALDNTPDYMVVDLAAQSVVRYYPGVDFLPGSKLGQTGAVTNNVAYRTSKLLMRKIMAHGVEWTMGSASGETQRRNDREMAHVVTLTNNYYIGVFEITQAQWKNIATNSTISAQFTVEGDMRPMERVCYNEIRNVANATAENAAYNWPADPNPSSFLGLLRGKTGLDFDLPSEAEWEFAARSGHGSGYWSDGSPVLNTGTDANLGRLGRYGKNNPGGTAWTSGMAPSAGGTASAGSYAPSDWGLYDVHGNVWELCLDWYEADIKANGGKVNISRSAPERTLSGASGANRAMRGGSWGDDPASSCRAAMRAGISPENRTNGVGLRVRCRAGLQ